MKKLFTLLVLSLFVFGCNSSDQDTTVNIYPWAMSLDSYLPVDTCITVSCKSDWKIENVPEWCSFKDTKGRGNDRIDLHISKNESSDIRYARIKINDAELILSQRGDVIDNGDNIGTFFSSCSDLTIVEYRVSGNTESPVDKYILTGNSGSVKDLCFYFRKGQNADYYLQTWLEFRNKISAATLRFRLNYEGRQSRYGYTFMRSNFDKLKTVDFDFSSDRVFETTDAVISSFYNNRLTITFTNCRFTTSIWMDLYYVINGDLTFEID